MAVGFFFRKRTTGTIRWGKPLAELWRPEPFPSAPGDLFAVSCTPSGFCAGVDFDELSEIRC